jgi:hypothetical protein
MRIPLFRSAIVTVLLAATTAGQLMSAAPAAAAIGAPDLTVALSATPNPVAAGEVITYTAQVSNSSTEQCRATYPEPICTVYGRSVTGVAMSLTIPAGATYQAGSGNHGFVCPSSASGSVTCTGGSLAMDDLATVTIQLRAPSAGGIISATTTVDPANAIAERSETNNTASVGTTVNPPPPPVPQPDLVVTGLTGTSSAAPGGQATYTATITNVGQASASNVDLQFWSGSSDWSLVSSSGTAGFAPCIWTANELKLVALCPGTGGGSLAPGQSATVTIVVQIPASASNTYYTYIILDPHNQVKESNESNNQSALFATRVG